ncbi:hypothetical protein WDU94_002147 [Cyamophila willieti]
MRSKTHVSSDLLESNKEIEGSEPAAQPTQSRNDFIRSASVDSIKSNTEEFKMAPREDFKSESMNEPPPRPSTSHGNVSSRTIGFPSMSSSSTNQNTNQQKMAQINQFEMLAKTISVSIAKKNSIRPSSMAGGADALCWACIIQIILALFRLYSRNRTMFPHQGAVFPVGGVFPGGSGGVFPGGSFPSGGAHPDDSADPETVPDDDGRDREELDPDYYHDPNTDWEWVHK